MDSTEKNRKFLEAIRIWNYSLSVTASNIFGNEHYIFTDLGKSAVEKLNEKGVDFKRPTPVETINAVYSYFQSFGDFEEAYAKASGDKTEGKSEVLDLYEKWEPNSTFCCRAADMEAGGYACFRFCVMRYVLYSSFGLDIKFIDVKHDLEKNEIFVKAALLPVSWEEIRSASIVQMLKDREEALEKMSEDFSKAIEMSLDAIITADQSGVVVLWNPAAEKIFGYKQNEIVGMKVDMLVPEEYRELHRKGLERFLSTGESMLIGKIKEVEGLRKDGSKVSIEMSLSAQNIKGKWVFTAVIRDITERRKLEAELKQKYIEMERLNKIMVGREIRMGELREELRDLRAKRSGAQG
ncbi:MAG: PAS domain S-box protein [Deltaproteobacteria bacterium]|nr:PAS domain S-box protein [Deltaproteobacteria bacterium]